VAWEEVKSLVGILVVLTGREKVFASGAVRFLTDDVSHFTYDRQPSAEGCFPNQQGVATGEGTAISGSYLEDSRRIVISPMIPQGSPSCAQAL
jgi:hypothetical protein